MGTAKSVKKAEKKKPVVKRSGRKGKRTLENSILDLARSGELKKAGQNAIRELHEKGISVTFMRGNEIVVQHADGTEEVAKRLKPVKFTPPAGVKIIENN